MSLFSIVSHRLIYENIIIWITNFSKRCGWQQKVINPFSLLRKPIEMITLSDNSRTSHIDKIKILSIDQKILLTVESHRWKDPLTISCFICQQLKQLNNFFVNKEVDVNSNKWYQPVIFLLDLFKRIWSKFLTSACIHLNCSSDTSSLFKWQSC